MFGFSPARERSRGARTSLSGATWQKALETSCKGRPFHERHQDDDEQVIFGYNYTVQPFNLAY